VLIVLWLVQALPQLPAWVAAKAITIKMADRVVQAAVLDMVMAAQNQAEMPRSLPPLVILVTTVAAVPWSIPVILLQAVVVVLAQ
jgi:hypothetical protein